MAIVMFLGHSDRLAFLFDTFIFYQSGTSMKHAACYLLKIKSYLRYKTSSKNIPSNDFIYLSIPDLAKSEAIICFSLHFSLWFLRCETQNMRAVPTSPT